MNTGKYSRAASPAVAGVPFGMPGGSERGPEGYAILTDTDQRNPSYKGE